MTQTLTPQAVRADLIARREIALIDLRPEAAFALGHPLFAAQVPAGRLALEAPFLLPRRSVRIVVYDNGEGLTDNAAAVLGGLGYSEVYSLAGGLSGWRGAGFELFEDVNSYAKAFGELVETRRATPSLSAQEVNGLLTAGSNLVVLDARRFDEFHTMNIPSAISVPGAELVLQAAALAPDPNTRIVVNCGGRTRSLIGTQSLINAGLPNPVVALRNGTIGWMLAGQELERGQTREAPAATRAQAQAARARARAVAYAAGVRRVGPSELEPIAADLHRTLYRFDVRPLAEHRVGHPSGFRHAPGGQLVQEVDAFAPVRGGRILLCDDLGSRADMSASWLAQMGWDVYVLDGGFDGPLETGLAPAPPSRPREGRYRRPYEGVDNSKAAMQAYLDWEAGLVDQLARDESHGFFVV